MDFGPKISELLRQTDPRAFNQIARSGQLQNWERARGMEAKARVAEILAREPRLPNGEVEPNARRCAEEIVLADLTDFVTELHPEPPDDLPPPG
jgi:hypothetical protein